MIEMSDLVPLPAITPMISRTILLPIAAVLAGFLCFVHAAHAQTLTADQLLIVTNKRVPESDQLARYYMKRRSVPAKNLVHLDTLELEDVSRQEYDREIAGPIRAFLAKNDPEGKKFRCIVLMYGIPLRVGPPVPSEEERRQISELRKRRTDVEDQIKASEKDKAALIELRKQQGAIQNETAGMSKLLGSASVDSEIALVMENRFSPQWLPNKYFVGFRGKAIENMPQKVLLVSRLDGPSDTIVRRIIDDSIEVEKAGLSGKAYFDARWPEKENKDPSYYQVYDRMIHHAARVVENSGKMAVVLDEQERLFQPGEAPDAALYCGWYSLGKYVDAFTWAKGAVGFHAASSECATLRNRTSTVWCKSMLEKGVAATVGPVAEPYLQSFPLPDVFFGCLTDGRPTLAECYAVSIPFWSWRMVLIGDPLYRPFAHHPTGAK
ncbi:MAG: TIGR03790 family protein [Syntrophorhabdales bacterium]|jgi:uncharacterized protein (TIGR03790 family)